MYTCMFCKRHLKECYDIFVASEETDNVAPHLDIIYFFGNSGLNFVGDQFICHPCLFLIRMLKYIREALEAVLKSDKDLDHLITCFEKFKMLLQAVDYSNKGDDKEVLVDSEYAFPEDSTIYASDSDQQSDEYLVELCSDYVHSDAYSDYSRRSPTPTSQEVEEVFSKKKKRKRRKSTNWTHRKRSYRASVHSRPYSSVSKASGTSRKSRTKSRASNASGTKSPQSSRLKYENGFLLNKTTRSVCWTQNKNLAKLVEMENSEYPCLINVCYKRHKSFDELLEHTRRDHHLLNEDLTEEIYNKQLQLYEERKKENERRKLKFTLSTRSVYKEENNYPCLIDQCFQKFYNFNNYIHHKIEGHNLFAKYWCRECNSLKFTSEDDYIKHNKMKHSYSINCLVCSEKMDNIYDLQQHLEKHRYICIACKYCDKSYLDYYSLLQHVETQHNEKTEKIQKRSKGSILEMYYYHRDGNKRNQSETNLDFINIRIQKRQKTDNELEEEDYNRYIISRRESDDSVNTIGCTPFSEHSNDIDLDGTVFNHEDFEVIEQELNNENEFNLNTLLEDITHQRFEDNVVVVTEKENVVKSSVNEDDCENNEEPVDKTENLIQNFEEIKNIIGSAPENVVINKGLDYFEETVFSKDSKQDKFVEDMDDVVEDAQLDEQLLDAHDANEDSAELVLEGFTQEAGEKDENVEEEEEFIENKIVEDEEPCEVVVEGYHVTGDAFTSIAYESEEIVTSVSTENMSEENENVELPGSVEKLSELESVESKTEDLEIPNDSKLLIEDFEEKKSSKVDYKKFEEFETCTQVSKKVKSLKASKKKKVKEEPLDNISQTILEVSKGSGKEHKKESNLYDLFIGNRNKNKTPKESPNKQNLYDTFIRRNSNDNDLKQKKQNYKNKYNTKSSLKELKSPASSPKVNEDEGEQGEGLYVSQSMKELKSNETITKEDVEEENVIKVPSIVEEVYVQTVDPDALYNSPTHTAQEVSTAETPVSISKKSRRISNPRKSDNNDKVLLFIEAMERSRLEKLKQKPPDDEDTVKKKLEASEVAKSPSPTKVIEQKLNNSIDSVIEQVKSRISSPTRKNKRKPDKTSKLCVDDDSAVKERTKRLGMSNVVKKVIEKNNGQDKHKKSLSDDLKTINNALYTSSAYKHVKKKFKK